MNEKTMKDLGFKKAGFNWKICCPYHKEKTPSCIVSGDYYHCFGCGKHGDSKDLIEKLKTK